MIAEASDGPTVAMRSTRLITAHAPTSPELPPPMMERWMDAHRIACQELCRVQNPDSAGRTVLWTYTSA